ncbi:hypothetical protein L1987_55619 [Smallanthus sonchifolius]|uniref:Uncharacterized protein n=1 Tax=Smallanthus sonchifolius TaxID=185202 RepID=A0ACB9EAH1_9ASTR|nr:hypothetical protein L1987_55619 [Smallanthus sonchifolius]
MNIGAHTIGQTYCKFFRYRLYNFTTTGKSDPSLSQSALTQFQTMYQKNIDDTEQVALDKDNHLKLDVNYYKNVCGGNGVLESDPMENLFALFSWAVVVQVGRRNVF